MKIALSSLFFLLLSSVAAADPGVQLNGSLIPAPDSHQSTMIFFKGEAAKAMYISLTGIPEKPVVSDIEVEKVITRSSPSVICDKIIRQTETTFQCQLSIQADGNASTD